MLLSVADGFQEVEEYRAHLTQQFISRAGQVTSTSAFDIDNNPACSH